LAELEVFRRIGSGAIFEAEALAKAIRPGGAKDPHRLAVIALGLLGAGCRSPWVEEACRTALADPTPTQVADVWLSAAGALATGEGLTVMERYLSQVGARLLVPHFQDLIRALWLSRQGRFAESLDRLESARARAPARSIDSAHVAEILARPIWMKALGADPGAAVIARALEAPPPGAAEAPGAGVAAYWASVASGRLDQAAAIAEELVAQDAPDPIWVLTGAWHARLTRETPP
jgi:hypothetical protein